MTAINLSLYQALVEAANLNPDKGVIDSALRTMLCARADIRGHLEQMGIGRSRVPEAFVTMPSVS